LVISAAEVDDLGVDTPEGDQRGRGVVQGPPVSGGDHRIYDALAGTDKAQVSIDTDHYFTTPGARSEQADTIAKWITKRWR
jgi:hypothetical protein